MLARLLRLVAVTVGLVCLGALAQALALTAGERRSAVATLRSAGADERALRRLLLGSALAVSLPAALLALGLELLVLAPMTERLTAGYADLPLRTDPAQVMLVAVGLAALAALATIWTAQAAGARARDRRTARGRVVRPTRREALALAGGGLAWALGACGSNPRPGSTRLRSLVDPDGDGLLKRGAAMPLHDRTDLGGGGRAGARIASLAHATDPHVRDAQSPARVPFLDRLGPRLGGAFRPHETLTAQVLAAVIASVNDWGEAQAVLVTGDLIDSAQQNELDWALTLLNGGSVVPNSGTAGYAGVQSSTNPDPLYYRPDVDAPRRPGLLRRALDPVRSEGLHAPWWPALGNHDVLVQGELAPSAAITAVATGDRLLVAPALDLGRFARSGRIDRAQVDALLRAGMPGDALHVAPDAHRAHLSAVDVLATAASGKSRRPRTRRQARLRLRRRRAPARDRARPGSP